MKFLCRCLIFSLCLWPLQSSWAQLGGSPTDTIADSSDPEIRTGGLSPQNNYGFGTHWALSVLPYIQRSTVAIYDGDKSPTRNENLPTTLGISAALQLSPLDFSGTRAQLTLEYQRPRRFEFVDSREQGKDFGLTAANLQLLLGYQFTSFYVDGGLQYPLDIRTRWDNFQIQQTLGPRIAVGYRIVRDISVEAFYGYHSTFMRELNPLDNNPRDFRLYSYSIGFVVRFLQIEDEGLL